MNSLRRHIILTICVLLGWGLQDARAEQFPSKPIKIIVPSGPGTSSDTIARFFSEALSKKLAEPVITENRPGAGALIGFMAAVNAPADGYTLLIASQPRYTMPMFNPETAKFDSITNFTSVARVARTSLVIGVSANSPYRTLSELAKAMRDNPGEATYASQGVGSSAHLCAALLSSLTNTSSKHIAYRQTSTGVLDVVAGRVDFTCQGSGSVLTTIQTGTMRALAVTGPNRWDALPNVPTGEEAGFPDLKIYSGMDFLAPAGVPEQVVQHLSQAIMEVAISPEFKEFCKKNSFVVDPLGYKDLATIALIELDEFKRLFEMTRDKN